MTNGEDLHQWVIVLDNRMSYDEAIECGKHMGKGGYTGVFLNGNQAKQICLIPKLKAEIKRLKGGDEVGKTEND